MESVVKVLYCWRCEMDIPMLSTSEEWKRVIPFLLTERQRALDAYHTITGFRETNAVALYHHTVWHHGPPCPGCGRPERTERATRCVTCGHVFDRRAMAAP